MTITCRTAASGLDAFAVLLGLAAPTAGRALVFGRVGDLVGRKYTFLVTIVVMGMSTVLVGVLPTYKTIGFAAPFILVALRLAQGLALGGEYGGAATYVAEHAPDHRRGYATAWIQTTATVGMLFALVVIGVTRLTQSAATFSAWGWRIAFWVSIPLLAISIYIRLKLQESPIFNRMKAQGKRSKAPITESFARYPNNKYVALALFGGLFGIGVFILFPLLSMLQASVVLQGRLTTSGLGRYLTSPIFLLLRHPALPPIHLHCRTAPREGHPALLRAP